MSVLWFPDWMEHQCMNWDQLHGVWTEINFIKDVGNVLKGKKQKSVLLTWVVWGFRVWINPALVLCDSLLPSLSEKIPFKIRPLPHLHKSSTHPTLLQRTKQMPKNISLNSRSWRCMQVALKSTSSTSVCAFGWHFQKESPS